jgi:hypothetical protein
MDRKENVLIGAVAITVLTLFFAFCGRDIFSHEVLGAEEFSFQTFEMVTLELSKGESATVKINGEKLIVTFQGLYEEGEVRIMVVEDGSGSGGWIQTSSNHQVFDTTHGLAFLLDEIQGDKVTISLFPKPYSQL